MHVEPYERARFIVTGTGGEPHTVDLLCYRGNGKCDCAHFSVRLEQSIREAREERRFKPSEAFRCPHIRAAREYLLDKFITELRKQYPDNNDIDT